jgi:large subunit ribosomal protein L10
MAKTRRVFYFTSSVIVNRSEKARNRFFQRGLFENRAEKGGETMPNLEKKQAVIQEIREKIDRAKSMVLVDARGLTVEQDTVLRKTLREAGVDYKVYKNTMINFAVEGTWSEGIKSYLAGPTTVAFSYDDATAAASLISKQFKAMPKLEFKAGVIEGVVYDADGMKAVADIPPREVLLSRLLGSFKSPMSSFARVINAIAEKQTGGAEAPAEALAEAAEVA